jgi:hypothetical protein
MTPDASSLGQSAKASPHSCGFVCAQSDNRIKDYARIFDEHDSELLT